MSMAVQTQRRTARRLIPLVVAAAAVGVSAAARAQSLGDAAKQAQQQRQSNPAQQSFSDNDLTKIATGNAAAVNLELTMPLLRQYNAVRTNLLRAMVQDRELANAVVGAVGRAGAGGVNGLEREYDQIPRLVETAQARAMSVHDYVVTEVAFMAAVGILAGKLPSKSPPGTIATNVRFLQDHQQEIAALWQEAFALEAQVSRQLGAAGSEP